MNKKALMQQAADAVLASYRKNGHPFALFKGVARLHRAWKKLEAND